MPKVALTDAGIRRLLSPEKGTETYWDTTANGLGVRVSPKGTKTFIALVKSGSRHKLGRYPTLSLASARDETRKLLAQQTLGHYEKPSTLTYDTAVEKYLAACTEKNRPRTVADYKKHLARFPFGNRRITSIKKRSVAAELEKITPRSMRAHVLTSVKVFFSWCASEGHIDVSPISALKPPATPIAKRVAKTKRALSPDEIRILLRAALAYPYPFGQIIALLLLTGQRRNEIATLRWQHITHETITIPADIAKNGIEHTFPYGKLVRQVLDSVPSYAVQDEYVFPARWEAVRGKPSTVFNGWSKSKKAFDETLTDIAGYKLHDLRRTFSTRLQALKVPAEVREKLVNHVSGTQKGVAGVYEVYGYEEEMKFAIAQYENFLLPLLAQG